MSPLLSNIRKFYIVYFLYEDMEYRDFGENPDPREERYELHLADKEYIEEHMPKIARAQQQARIANQTRRRQAEPAHYQRFLAEALPLASTCFEDQSKAKETMIKKHFPHQYEAQKISSYDSLKLGATFAQLVRSAHNIVERKRR